MALYGNLGMAGRKVVGRELGRRVWFVWVLLLDLNFLGEGVGVNEVLDSLHLLLLTGGHLLHPLMLLFQVTFLLLYRRLDQHEVVFLDFGDVWEDIVLGHLGRMRVLLRVIGLREPCVKLSLVNRSYLWWILCWRFFGHDFERAVDVDGLKVWGMEHVELVTIRAKSIVESFLSTQGTSACIWRFLLFIFINMVFHCFIKA